MRKGRGKGGSQAWVGWGWGVGATPGAARFGGARLDLRLLGGAEAAATAARARCSRGREASTEVGGAAGSSWGGGCGCGCCCCACKPGAGCLSSMSEDTWACGGCSSRLGVLLGCGPSWVTDTLHLGGSGACMGIHIHNESIARVACMRLSAGWVHVWLHPNSHLFVLSPDFPTVSMLHSPFPGFADILGPCTDGSQ